MCCLHGTLIWWCPFFPNPLKGAQTKIRFWNNRFSFYFCLTNKFVATTISCQFLRWLTIIASIYKTAIQLTALLSCYGYYTIFCVNFAPIYLSLFMLLSRLFTDSKIFKICCPIRPPCLARQAFLRYRRNQHCWQVRHFEYMLIDMWQKVKLSRTRRKNVGQVSLIFISKCLALGLF